MGKTRMASTVIAALILAVVPLAAAAGGSGEMRYRDVVTDARQANMPAAPVAKWADVLKGSKVIVVHDQKSETIRVKVWARRDFPIPKRVFTRHVRSSYMRVDVFIDLRGDRMPEIRISGEFSRSVQSCHVDTGQFGEFIAKCRIDTARDGALVIRTHEPLKVGKLGRWQIVTGIAWTPKGDPRHPRDIPTFDLAPQCVWSCQ